MRVKGKVAGDDDTSGHAHAKARTRAVTKAKTKARRREDEDTSGHAHAKSNARVVAKAKTKARRREDDDTEGHRNAKSNARVVAKAKTKARRREDDDTEGHRNAKSNARVVAKAKTKARRREDDDTSGHAVKKAKAKASPALRYAPMSSRPSSRSLDQALAIVRAGADRAAVAERLHPGGEERLLQSIVDATVRLFDAEAASIALFERDPDRLEFRVAAGPRGAGAVGKSVRPSQGIAGFVFSTGQALALSDVGSDPRFDRKTAEKTGYVPRSIAAVPLTDEQGTHGVLQVLDKKGSATFDLRDMEEIKTNINARRN
jgi:hypothetical protein